MVSLGKSSASALFRTTSIGKNRCILRHLDGLIFERSGGTVGVMSSVCKFKLCCGAWNSFGFRRREHGKYAEREWMQRGPVNGPRLRWTLGFSSVEEKGLALKPLPTRSRSSSAIAHHLLGPNIPESFR
jgi:hypothetical protein